MSTGSGSGRNVYRGLRIPAGGSARCSVLRDRKRSV